MVREGNINAKSTVKIRNNENLNEYIGTYA